MRKRRMYVTAALSCALHRAWSWLRQVSGDAAYENYLRSRARRQVDSRDCCGIALTKEEFYLDALRRRYSGASRCC
jgi:uncharacterized short protein YbdD (DUF466 family)